MEDESSDEGNEVERRGIDEGRGRAQSALKLMTNSEGVLRRAELRKSQKKPALKGWEALGQNGMESRKWDLGV